MIAGTIRNAVNQMQIENDVLEEIRDIEEKHFEKRESSARIAITV